MSPDNSKPATTTARQDLDAHRLARINLIWESTQAAIALLVVVLTMLSCVWDVIKGNMDQIPSTLSLSFGTVVGFYFGRTNHSRPTGGSS